jgi:hypothetical protein
MTRGVKGAEGIILPKNFEPFELLPIFDYFEDILRKIYSAKSFLSRAHLRIFIKAPTSLTRIT